jgi:hypothetical protein
MRKVIVILLTFLFTIAFYHKVNAAVLNFEDLYPGYETYAPLPAGYAGFNWEQDAWWMAGPGRGTIGSVCLFTAWADPFFMSRSVPFDFQGAYITAMFQPTENVSLEGWREGSQVYNQTITTYNDSPHWFDLNFSNVDKVWFIPQGAHIAIDNITYHPIPEPATFSLLGLGLLGLFGLRKKQIT